MKKHLLFFFILLIAQIGFAQENGITYQAVLYQPNGEQLPGQNDMSAPLANTPVCLRFGILDIAENIEYQEVVKTKTDGYGMVNLVIGTHNQTGGYVAGFDDVLWDGFEKYLKIEIDINNSCSQFEEISNQRFNYVPMALNARSADNVTGTVAFENGGTGANTMIGAKVNLELELVDNTSDLDKPVSLATKQALDDKENTVNKSLDVLNDGLSDMKYPSVKAVKDYVDLNSSTGSQALTEEVLRATAAEETLALNLEKEISRAMAAEATKESLSNKSINITTDAESDAKYPSVKSVKTYIDVVTTAINTLADGTIYLGNASNEATEVTMTGDVTIDNAGVSTIGANKVITGMIADANVTTAKIADANITTAKIADANITDAKLDKTNIPLSGFGAAGTDVALGNNKLTGVADPTLAQDAATKNYVDDAATAINTLADGKVYLGDATNQAAEVTITGDVTMSNAGVSTIGASKVVTGMIADGTILVGDLANDAVETTKIKDANVTTAKIADANITTAKIADANITNAKLDKTNIPLSGFGAAGADVALGANKLTGVANPTNDQDAATKKYVDDAATAINTLADGKIYLGDASNEAAEVTMTGDVTIDNAGVSTIGASKVVTGMIADGTILVGDLANDAVETTKIKDANVTTAKIADANVTTAKILDANITTAKIADANITNAKLDKTNIPLSGFGAAGADVALGANKLTGVADPTNDQDAATKKYVDDAATAINTLADATIYLGDENGNAQEVTLSGDVTINNAGISTIGASKVVTGMIADGTILGGDLANDAVETAKIKDANVTTAKIADANITNAKLDKTNIPLSGFGAAGADVALGANKLTGVANPTNDQDATTKKYVDDATTAINTLADGTIYLGDENGDAQEVSLSGDVTIDNAGVSTIGEGKVVTGMIADGTILVGDLANDAVETAKIKDANVTTAKIADANITNAKLDKTNIPLSGFGAASADVALGANKLTGVADPTLAQDAATKKYVDDAASAINTLADGTIYLGDENGDAQEVTITGDVTINNAGVSTIGAGKVVTGMIADGTILVGDFANNAVETAKIKDANVTTAKIADANITNAKLDKTNIPLSGFGAASADVALGANKLTGVADPTLAQDAATKKYVDDAATAINTLADGKIYLGDTSNEAAEVTMTGDVTINNAGVSTIGASKVVTGMIADGTILVGDFANNAVETSKIKDANVTTAKIADANITNAKLDKTNIPLSGFGAASADVALGANKLTGVKDPTLAQDAATKKYVDDAASAINTLADGTIYLGDENGDAQEVTLSGDVTINNAGVSTIGASKVVTGMIADGTILVGDLANDAVETAKIKNANVTTAKIADANITTAKILDANVTNAKLDKTNIPLSGFGAAGADVALGANKLTGVANPTNDQDAATKKYVDDAATAINTLADGKIYLGDASNQAAEVTITGDVTINNAGVSTIGTSKVVTGMIADGTILVGDLANNAVETAKIKDANVTNAKLDKTNIPLSGFGAAGADVALGANKLTGVKDPTNYQDAATKKYVDTNTGNNSSKIGAIIAATGLNSNGSYAPTTGANYISSASSVAQADSFLDTQIKLNTDGIATISTASNNLITEVNAIEAATGLNADGTYATISGTNYIGSASSVAQADTYLDAAIKANSDAISLKATIASPTFTGTVGGITKSMVGLGNVDNTSDATKNAATSTLTNKTLTSPIISTISNTGTLTLPTATGTIALTSDITTAAGSYVNLTTAQTIAGTKTFSSDAKINGITVGVGGGDAEDAAYNTALGLDALVNNTGWGNTAIGRSTLTVNANSNNTAVGYEALKASKNGSFLVALGSKALANNNDGNANTVLGANSLTNNTDGSQNLAIGGYALSSNVSGNQNTALGVSADVVVISGVELTNATAIGYNAKVTASNTIQLGNTAISDVRTVGVVTAAGYKTATGTTAQFLKADGSVDSSTYLTASGTATNVSGIVAIANGGTGSATQNFVDLTTNQTVAGTKTFSSDLLVNGVAIGKGAGSVTSNTAAGVSSLGLNTTGFHNTSFGLYSLHDNLVGSRNVAIGSNTLYNNLSYDNTAVGYLSLQNNTNGDHNVGIGSEALKANTDGNYNSGVGFLSLWSNTSGVSNSAMGGYSLLTNSTGSNNTAFGNNSLQKNTTANQNTAIGSQAMQNNTTGAANATVGIGTIDFNTTGSNNAVIGAFSGRYIANGTTNATVINNSVLIGANTKPLADNGTNEIVIGYNAIGNGSNTIQLGNTAITEVKTSGAITAASYIKSGGTSSEYLMADGSVSTGAAPVREVADEVTATTSQISFTLTQAPSANSKVKMYVNGIRISNTAYSVSGSTLTYVPANNGGYTLTVSDRIQFDYYY